MTCGGRSLGRGEEIEAKAMHISEIAKILLKKG